MRCEKNKAEADPFEQVIGGEPQAKIVLDLANKKRNTSPCLEVGYVASSLPIGAGFSDSPPPRFTNHSTTLSRVP